MSQYFPEKIKFIWQNRYIRLAGIIAAGIVLFNQFFVINTTSPAAGPALTEGECIPTFKDGDGPYYRPDSPFRTKIVPDTNSGQRLAVEGRVLQNDCQTPVPDAVLDIWQADETGSYRDEWYRGKIRTDRRGNYRFETVIPKGYGAGTAHRPPHIHFKVFINDRLIITSEMFFPEVSGRPGFDEAFIMDLQETGLNGSEYFRGYHDIILP